jgi:HlyD family secretion protein
MSVGKTICMLVVAVCMAALGYLVSYWYPPSRSGAVSRVAAAMDLRERATRIEAQGRLEPVSGTLAVSAIPGEEIVELSARAGQSVSRGDVLAVLGSRVIREAERVLAERQLEKARRQIEAEEGLAQLREELAAVAQLQAQAKAREIPPEESIRVAEAREALAAARLEKLEQLSQDPRTRDAIAETELEQQRLLLRQIQVDLEQHRAQLQAARQSQELAQRAADLDMALAKATREQLVPISPVPALEQSVELARLAEEASLVRAPCDGTILEVYARQGERVANTPILQLGDLRQMVCIAEVHEANLKDLEVQEPDDAGQHTLAPARPYRTTIRSAALTQELTGQIVEVGQLIGAPALRDPNPLAPADRRTVKVRIALDESSSVIARRFVHLQVNVTIHLTDADAPKD